MMGQEELLSTLEAGAFSALVGQPELQWLDFKRSPYPLETDTHRWELAKDIAALANGGGGLIVLGVCTMKTAEGDEERASELRPFPLAQVDPKAYEMICENWITPTPVVHVRKHPHGPNLERGLMSVEVESCKAGPVVVYRGLVDGKVKGNAVGVYSRVGARARVYDHHTIRALLRDGQAVQNGTYAPAASLAEALRSATGATGAARSFEDGANLARFAHGMSSDYDEERRAEALSARVGGAMRAAQMLGGPGLLLIASPQPVVQLPDLFESRDAPRIRAIDQPPILRPRGFNIKVGNSAMPIAGRFWRAVDPGGRVFEVHKSGEIIYGVAATTDELCWGDEPGRINQMYLAEVTLLFCDVATQVYSGMPDFDVDFCLELRFAAEGRLKLAPGPVGGLPRTDAVAHRSKPRVNVQASHLLPAGRIAFMLLSPLYSCFGLPQEAVPYRAKGDFGQEIDRKLIIAAGAR